MSSYLSQAMSCLRPLLTDDLVEIVINQDLGVWVERRGDVNMARAEGLGLTPADLKQLVTQIANEASIRFSEQKPVFSVSLDFEQWRIRAQVVAAPALETGYAVALRFFSPQAEIIKPTFLHGKPISSDAQRAERNREMKQLAESNSLDAALRFCVEHKLNLIVSGGTSSGKTMVARHLQAMISDAERIITIEDAPDLLPQQPNKVMLVSLENDDYRSSEKLLQACLRMRPDRIILSEVRNRDAYTFLKAINTGHGGSITTLHADTARLAVSRLAQAALEATPGMTYSEMVSYIGQSIDVIVHTAKVAGQRGIIEFFLPGQEISE
ncbi:type IV secretion system protein VirB11 [Primorskyibacter sedentarius]|uniref:Type IV secretion system protein VirB11 n=1 Tax=Primorskyibacter sedentarius TaxID=745311 RepID=A0A4R3IWN1_9RHOB|nr:ATPase, T2SS/T4P/T4SS family [Primorskyibacter sedentarius]TCS56543.1 type IV secretion system protein VirB11 [Primorskyibacter sedentarius]